MSKKSKKVIKKEIAQIADDLEQNDENQQLIH